MEKVYLEKRKITILGQRLNEVNYFGIEGVYVT
jgi:hypothetical protein